MNLAELKEAYKARKLALDSAKKEEEKYKALLKDAMLEAGESDYTDEAGYRFERIVQERKSMDWKYVGARYSDGDYMDPYDKESWELTGAKMVVVDGEKIKEDTYYRCIEGEIVEVTEDGEIVED